MMKKLVCLIMVLAMGSIASAGQRFTGVVDNKWATPGNWSDGVPPNDSTTFPGGFVPQWGNDVGINSNAVLDIGPGEDWASYSFQIALFGEDNVNVNISGGSLTVGVWGLDIGRGNSNDHGTGDGTLTMTGGTINSHAIIVPQEWRNSGVTGTITGLLDASGGIINGSFMRIGMFDGPGTVLLSGNVVVNLETALQMNVGFGGWNEPDTTFGASLVINDNAVIHIGGQGGGLPEDLLAELDIYNAYIFLGWITSSSGTPVVTYNAGSDIITIVPEPATLALLGLGGLLIRRKAKARS